MVREGGREHVEDMRFKVEVPFGIAKKCVDLAHSWVFMLISPSELSIFVVNFFELTSLEGCSKSILTVRFTFLLLLSLEMNCERQKT
jgi:hypothetical protein